MSDRFPRQHARTQRFSLGEPRDLTVTADGARVVFAQSDGGDDPVNRLWIADLADGDPRLVADPLALLAEGSEGAGGPDARELAQRERRREVGAGITAFSCDADSTRCAFALDGRLAVTELDAPDPRWVDTPGAVFDPRISPDGRSVAYVSGAELWIVDVGEREGAARRLAPATTEPPDVSWGGADFVAAEEMHRFRGFWWHPEGTLIAACRVDESPVSTWHISDPAAPERAPRPIRYPAAGTANAVVELHLVDVESGHATQVAWDRDALPYLAEVDWSEHGLAITVQSRDQRELQVLVVDETDGTTRTIWSDVDDAWVELVPGSGRLVGPDQVVTATDDGGTRRLVVAGDVVSPPDVQVRSIVAATSGAVVVLANPLDDPGSLLPYRWTPDGFVMLLSEPGVHQVLTHRGHVVGSRFGHLDGPDRPWRLASGARLPSRAETPDIDVNLRWLDGGARPIGVCLPSDHDGRSLPVLMDPYGGPHGQRVVRSYHAWCTSQWFADQGFAVVVADGRGTPGLGSADERSIRGDLATGVLDDQVDALRAAAGQVDGLDLGRVAIRGWSFGGYLAALAVMRRPDVFHTAIAGAPVTEWRLYDTHYTERYLGDPGEQPEVYDASSLLPLADRLERPLLLIHGLADDNVVAAHSLRLSAALLAAGKGHEVLPLVGVTHMTSQEVVAEHLLLHQLDFLRRSLPVRSA